MEAWKETERGGDTGWIGLKRTKVRANVFHFEASEMAAPRWLQGGPTRMSGVTRVCRPIWGMPQ
jgi:hypothetical protein